MLNVWLILSQQDSNTKPTMQDRDIFSLPISIGFIKHISRESRPKLLRVPLNPPHQAPKPP